MEELILQFAFDREAMITIQDIRNHIRVNEFVDRQRGWLPHITINKYNVESQDKEKFIKLTDEIISNYSLFNLHLEALDNFINGENDGTLYIKPTETENLCTLKQQFDVKLEEFTIESRKKRYYTPHITLCTNNMLKESSCTGEICSNDRRSQVCFAL